MPSKSICTALAVATGMALLAFEGAAHADGSYGQVPYPYEPPPYLPSPFLWKGLYVGGHIGGAWALGTLNDNFTGTGLDTDHSGFIGGGQLGFNYQVRNLVLGVEWDFDWTSASEARNDVFVPQFGTLRASADTDWITTLVARVGLANDRWLGFIKIGGGWVHNNATLANLTTGAVASTSDTNGGFLVGGGVEYALTGHWIARAEFESDLQDLDLALERERVPKEPGCRSIRKRQVVNYKF